MLRLRLLRARRQYACTECGLPIRPGEQYCYVFGVWDGDAQTHRICSTCEWLRERIALAEMEAGCGAHEACPGFSGLYEALDNGHDKAIGLVRLAHEE